MAATRQPLEFVREEDYVEYFLFPDLNSSDLSNVDIDIVLNNHLARVNEIVQQCSHDYLWHKDEFKLACRINTDHLIDDQQNNKESLPPHLYGISHYGDNIEDEWFIVYLLVELSKKLDGLVIRVVDSDGEFLLIESANFLPAWANPDTCDKRVYLYEGKLHIIPMDIISKSEDIELGKVMELVRNDPLMTEASAQIQDAVFNRINGYPDKIKELTHRTTVYLPVGVANILSHRPNLIAPAILAFCDRDPIDMKACRAMKFFPPENRVLASVRFSRCLYAMVTHSKFSPDRRTGWNLPSPTSPQYKSHMLGVKIACGFEILAAQAKPSPLLENDKCWLQYLGRLRERGYFRDLLEYSREHDALLDTARHYFEENRAGLHYSPVLGQQVLELAQRLGSGADQLRLNEANLPPDDDEAWLHVGPQQLDRLLAERFGSDAGTRSAADVTGKLSEFLEHVSGHEGAEFPERPGAAQGSPPVRPQRGVKKKDKTKVSFAQDAKADGGAAGDGARVNFDPANFTCAVQNILNLVIPEDNWDLESGSEMSEYGDESDLDLDALGPGQPGAEMKQYMDEMDKELAHTTVGQPDTFDDIENFQPVSVDMSVLRNMLESYKSQMGGAGPAANLLGPMGVSLEPGSSRAPE